MFAVRFRFYCSGININKAKTLFYESYLHYVSNFLEFIGRWKGERISVSEESTSNTYIRIW